MIDDNGADAAGALLARKTWRTLEPLHGMVYFVPEAAEAYARLGHHGPGGLLRVAGGAHGRGDGRRRRLDLLQLQPRARARGDPCGVGGGDAGGAGQGPLHRGRRGLPAPPGRGGAGVGRDATGGRAGAAWPPRRPADGWRGDRWPPPTPMWPGPPPPHLVLWHAQSILREYRGDGHIAQLVVRGLSGLEALVTHAAAGDVPERLLRSTRGWPQEAWDGAVDALAATRLARAGRRAPLHRAG